MGDIKVTDLATGMEIKKQLFVLWNSEHRKASNNKYYMDFMFKDQTGR